MDLQPYELEHIAAVRKALPECIVLLKKNGAFPLEGPCRLAAFGNGVRHTIKGGTGSGEVNSRYSVTIEQGLQEAGFTLTTTQWLDSYDQELIKAKENFHKYVKEYAKKNHLNPIMAGMGMSLLEPEYDLALLEDLTEDEQEAPQSDACVYVVSRISGEGTDRRIEKGDVLLTSTEIRDIRILNQKYEKFILVLNVGGPVDLSPVADVGNILVLSQLGVEAGNALADLLLGKTYPSGKLTTTWAKVDDYCSVGGFGDFNDTRYTEGVYVGYRYFDSVGKDPLFPFGFGLGYTEFALSDASAAVEGEKVTVTATVTNTGSFPGKEVVQAYVSSPQGKLDQPFQALAGFEKSKELEPGASDTLTFSFDLSSLASYDEEIQAWILEQGDFVLRVGNSSRNTKPVCIFRLPETVKVLQVKNVLGKPDFTDWKPETVQETLPEELPVLEVDPSFLVKEYPVYDVHEEIDPVVHEMTDEELAYMNVGAFNPKGGALSIIGSASFKVAGAAGETTSQVKTSSVPTIVMADGPAGVRISKDYFIEKGKPVSYGPSLPESIMETMPKAIRAVLKLTAKKPPKNTEILHQYATAIPIGTAIAQSFNLKMAEELGDLVGFEMEMFGVQLWLAPAMNIHRSILCGRNFEYFSEDPLVSGLMAAAITCGVQRHPGCGTTIKHYAANNQETNRYNNNSQVSERAMREIYLKGFGICVGLSQPHALMTSYNLLNGTHTSESRALIQDILRSEFGFKGIVMTDWIITMSTNKTSIHPNPTAYKIAAAGGDVVMPGSKGDFENILEARREGKLTRTQLEKNATRIYRMAKFLNKVE